MKNLARMVMSLTCFAAAGGIVLNHQREAPKNTTAGQTPDWIASSDRLDHLLGQLGATDESFDGQDDGPIVITNQVVEALARSESALPFDPMAVYSVSPTTQPVLVRWSGHKSRDAKAQGRRRGGPSLVGSNARPQTLWQQSRWRDHLKAKELDRRLKGKRLGSRSRIAKYRKNSAVQYFGEQNPKTHFQRSRHYRVTGSNTTNLRKQINRAIRR